MSEKLAYTIREAAAEIGLSLASVRRLIDRGELPSVKPSGIHVRLVKHTDLAAYIARQQPTPARSSAD